MKIKCLVCNESPIIELPEPKYPNQEYRCPVCDLIMATSDEQYITGKLFWYVHWLHADENGRVCVKVVEK
jgi:hypothetical protein